jgi:hypothetical protein
MPGDQERMWRGSAKGLLWKRRGTARRTAHCFYTKVAAGWGILPSAPVLRASCPLPHRAGMRVLLSRLNGASGPPLG